MNKRRGIRLSGSTNYGCNVFQNESVFAGESGIEQDTATNFIVQYNRNDDSFTPNDFIGVFSLGDQRESVNSLCHSVEHNFHQNVDAILGRGFQAVWNETEQAYLHTFDDDAGEFSGIQNIIYVPSGATLRSKSRFKGCFWV